MKLTLTISATTLLACSSYLLPSQSQAPAGANPSPKPSNSLSRPVEPEGVRIFKANCSRCHTAPDGFSSRISATVVRHMRVRASLSRHDEEELLRFFNP